MKATVLVVGPGGVGKGPLGQVFRPEIAALDPYRLRPKGPKKDRHDPFYAHPKLQEELRRAFVRCGDRALRSGDNRIEWFPNSRALFFLVRDEWQLLLLDPDVQPARGEIYAPALISLLSTQYLRDILGRTQVLFLNPAARSISAMPNWAEIENATKHNCLLRGDSDADVEKRVNSVLEEAPAWQQLVKERLATEYLAWEFPEYKYRPPFPAKTRYHTTETS